MKRVQLLPLLASTLFAGTLVSGCSSSEGFPSLEKRAAEDGAVGGSARITGSAAVALVAPDAAASEAPVSADLTARLAQLDDAARAARTRFDGKRGRTAQLVSAAQGAAVASEQWSVATVALADLTSARSDAMVSLGELDRLYVAERINGGDGSTIAAVRDQVTAWVADEDAVLADLESRMSS